MSIKARFRSVSASIECRDDNLLVVSGIPVPILVIRFGCNSWYLGANIPGKTRIFMSLASGFPAYAERCAEVAAREYEGFALG